MLASIPKKIVQTLDLKRLKLHCTRPKKNISYNIVVQGGVDVLTLK